MSQGHSAVHRLIYLETNEKKTTVGQVSRYDLKLTTKASNWRVGGLVVSCVGGLVGGMAERNWYWAHMGFFSRQNQLLFFEME